jgi:hypothetical protein
MSEVREWAEISKWADHWERGQLLLRYADDLPLAEFWRAVADAWSDCERQFVTPEDWRRMWTSRPDDDLRWLNVMTDAERAEFEALPDRVRVWRGVNARNRVRGLSWTLDCRLAHWFAGRFEGPSVVIAGIVLRRRVLALFQARSESEVVVFPRYVYGRTWERLDRQAGPRAAR